ncbi:PAS domain-containing hybrid sensor histidine kinase/response regulator [Oryzibacter oryziterrae]|uniref:PAS domain-containing hybrid sensor histidine kinase/response regulator n=1 Tax=Oryzibacter oryziterrae TaxID=2766474 RepID=UPI001F1ED5F7|nr:PAS domain-containing hybrid sensor histidine kinase/response regulator [Oryzibacter oryziterrae]
MVDRDHGHTGSTGEARPAARARQVVQNGALALGGAGALGLLSWLAAGQNGLPGPVTAAATLAFAVGLAATAHVAGRLSGEARALARFSRNVPLPGYGPAPRDGVDDVLIRRDPAGRIVAVNDALAQLIGQNSETLVGLEFAVFAADLRAGRYCASADGEPRERIDGWTLLRRRLGALGFSQEGEAETVGLEGDMLLQTVHGPRWFSWSEEAIVERGVAVGTRSRGRDITDRKAIEAALTDARDQAEAASAAKSRFLAMVSHEIRTPLNGILGMTGLLRQTQLSAEQKTYAQAIETSGEALLLLIEDLLDFSKIEAGRLDLQPSPMSLQTTVEELVELLAPRAHAKGIELAAYIDPRLPATVLADPVRIKQVLFNLAGNGIKFTAEGGVAIEVLPGGTAGDEQVAVLFQVRDTGIGIGAADQQRIFGEFEQADPGPARAFGGTGLGLAIARRLVRLMGGDIELESAPGSGACFSFTVSLALEGGLAQPVSAPIIEPEAGDPSDLIGETGARAAFALLEASFARKHDADLPVEAPLPPQRGDRPLNGRRVLVVSHALIEGPLVLRRLFDAGADVTLATQKDIEVEVSGSWRPDAVLVDAAAGDAIALIERIRSVSEVPVGVLIDPRERPRLGELQVAGYKAYLVKPVRARSLIAVVETLVGDSSFAAAGDLAPASLPADVTEPAASLNVLLCDDNEINLLLGRGLLEKLGHRVTVAADGRRAVSLVATALDNGEALYDVILMDLHMPEMDGIEAARQIRRQIAGHGVGRGPHIVALTADVMPETRARCEADLFDDWLRKPLEPFDLSRSLAGASVEAHAS